MGISIHLDHLATWNEVCEALAHASRDALELERSRAAEIELQAAICGGAGTLGEELAWLHLACEALDSQLN
jgi:hypothetical protein